MANLIDNVLETLGCFFEAGETFEIRVLANGGDFVESRTLVYGNEDFMNELSEMLEYDGKYNIYFTFNPIKQG